MQPDPDAAYRRPEFPTEERVDDLLDRMTVAEKAGQLVGTWVGRFVDDHDLDDAKGSIRDHHLGLATPFGWAGAHARDAGAAVEAANELQRVATEETRLGVPLLLNVDAVRGNAYVAGATVFPNALGAAATWDPALVEADAAVTAAETRLVGARTRTTWSTSSGGGASTAPRASPGRRSARRSARRSTAT